ncbi:hypothetical protein TNCV_4876321 [Trichonephila clavipes]|uniref:Uncharacterized protein n=1 Tax=Trichonephila clavipes TaxID=2585209 RepID=A0A8X6RLT7_TRICX|nr:hypothetical protein TNCV_4876321 [Trichonephila clavipes]
MKKRCDEAGLFPLIAKSGGRQSWKIPDISLIAGKEFRNWVVKDSDPLSQAIPTVKKRRRNIGLSFFDDSVTTARLKTYNVHRAISAQPARDQMGRDRQGRHKNKRSKKELGGEHGERREADSEPEKLYVREPDWRPLQLKTCDTAIPESAKAVGNHYKGECELIVKIEKKKWASLLKEVETDQTMEETAEIMRINHVSESNMEAIGDGPYNFDPRSSDEDDSRAGTPSPYCHTTPTLKQVSQRHGYPEQRSYGIGCGINFQQQLEPHRQ